MQEEFDPNNYEIIYAWRALNEDWRKVYGDERDWCDPKNANIGKRMSVILESF